MRGSSKFALLVVLLALAFVLSSRGYLGSLIHPLPFSGPYSGRVFDIASGKPIAGARVTAKWWCYDSPDPHLGNYWVDVSATTDAAGHFALSKPARRAGWFGGSFSFHVDAHGYVPAVALAPDDPPLPASTRAYPFVDTRQYSALPQRLDVPLTPLVPRLLQTLGSENAQYRALAAEELGKHGRGNADVIGALQRRLVDPDAGVRRAVAAALRRLRVAEHE